MIHQEKNFKVVFWLKNFGYTTKEVVALDAKQAIERVEESLVKKYDNPEFLFHSVNEAFN